MKSLRRIKVILICLIVAMGLLSRTIEAQSPMFGVNEIAWNPDGSLLAIANFDGQIYILNEESELVQTLSGYSDGAFSVAWSPNGDLLATSGNDNQQQLVKIWNMNTGLLVATLSDYMDLIGQIAFSPNGEYLVGTGFSETIVWDTVSWNVIATPGVGTVNSVSWSPDGNNVAFASLQIRIFSSDTFNHIMDFSSYTDQIYSLEWSPDSQLLISGGRDGTIRLWDTATLTPLGILLQANVSVNVVTFSPDGTKIAAGLQDGIIQILNTNTGQIIESIQTNSEVWTIDWHPDGEIIAYGGISDNSNELAHIVEAPSVLTCDTTIVSGDVTGLINAIDSANNTPEADTICLEAGTYTLTAVDNSSNGDNGLPQITRTPTATFAPSIGTETATP